MDCRITVLPQEYIVSCKKGENLLSVLRTAGIVVDAPCGGTGRCGKCKVTIDGEKHSACRITVERSMTVTIPQIHENSVASCRETVGEEYCLALDIGTTTVVGCLLGKETGREAATGRTHNPQAPFGADVISRIRHAKQGGMELLTAAIQKAVETMTIEMCAWAGVDPKQISLVSFVGNPAMQQLFLGISPENLARIPYRPVLTQAKYVPAKKYIPCCHEAELMIVPDISGFVGADTAACVLATGMDQNEKITLLVDIGTNGEMVLRGQGKMVACSTAAGPALEGANITCGMGGREGAIDHVWIEDGKLCCSVIGDCRAEGICGSGLIDAVAAALKLGLLDGRGRIIGTEKQILLCDGVFLTQEDIRQVQVAKGAIAAGIELMAQHMGIELQSIDQVYLAGAFGTFMNPESACRIGLLPPVLLPKIKAVGNAALSGAKMLVRDRRLLDRIQNIVEQAEAFELAASPAFRRCFAQNMRF